MFTSAPRPTAPLPRAFYDRPVLDVAPDLLGAYVVTRGPDGTVVIRLTEVEAYDGERDPGSHAFRGRTVRNAVMYGPPGGLYVYFTYGMHYCANLVCGPEGWASAVLLRAGEIVDGIEVAAARRARPGRALPPEESLARGPANLARALGLTIDGHGGLDVTVPTSLVTVHPATREEPVQPHDHPGRASGGVLTGPRVGVSGPGGDAATYPWRFWLPGNPTVSAYRPAVSRSPRRTKRITPGEGP